MCSGAPVKEDPLPNGNRQATSMRMARPGGSIPGRAFAAFWSRTPQSTPGPASDAASTTGLPAPGRPPPPRPSVTSCGHDDAPAPGRHLGRHRVRDQDRRPGDGPGEPPPLLLHRLAAADLPAALRRIPPLPAHRQPLGARPAPGAHRQPLGARPAPGAAEHRQRGHPGVHPQHARPAGGGRPLHRSDRGAAHEPRADRAAMRHRGGHRRPLRGQSHLRRDGTCH